jgi:lysophospholipase L1-like esterase
VDDSAQSARQQRRRRIRWVFRLVMVAVVSVVAAEVTARLVCTRGGNGMLRFREWPLLPFRPSADAVESWLESAADAVYMIRDKELGWTLAASATGKRYATNAQAFRADPERVYPLPAPTERVRVIVAGDSFTHGDGVSLEGTWAWQLEDAEAGLEVVNLGVPAYGTDQAFLRWRRHHERGLRGQVVVLGIWPENVCRNLNRVRYYLQPGGGYSTKPRFVLEGGSLTLLPPPSVARDALPPLLAAGGPLEHERWLDPDEQAPRLWHLSRVLRLAASLQGLLARREARERLYHGQDPAGNDVTVAIAERFAEEVRASGATPLILILPMRDLLDRYGEEPLPLVDDLRAVGLDVVDMFPAFSEAPAEGRGAWFQDDGHLSVFGNRVVAYALADALRERKLLE